MTGSVIVPIKAVIMNILSLGASFGAMVWIFQDGHLSGLLDFDSVGALDLWMPVLILIFAFGLSMDYEVFLLSRIKEVHDQTGDNDLAVAVGLQRSGRIITSAAALIVVVFAGFAAGEVLAVKQLGVGLAIAVIVDATIVRTLLVPATMKLLGERNWWAPRAAATIPRRASGCTKRRRLRNRLPSPRSRCWRTGATDAADAASPTSNVVDAMSARPVDETIRRAIGGDSDAVAWIVAHVDTQRRRRRGGDGGAARASDRPGSTGPARWRRRVATARWSRSREPTSTVDASWSTRWPATISSIIPTA